MAGFDPDPPECLSQVWGAAYHDAYMRHAARLREEGRIAEAAEAVNLAAYYGGFMRLVR